MNAEVLTIKGEKFAILPFDVWEKIQETLEDLQDIADAKEIEARIQRGEREYFPAELVEAIMLNGKNKIQAFREYRGMTQEALAEAIGKSVILVRKLESGATKGSIDTIKAVSEVLKVDINNLI